MIQFNENRLILTETPYVSIQGEGSLVGYPMTFVRLQGCPVGCVWCDSYYTWKPFNSEKISTDIKIPDPMIWEFKNLKEHLDKLQANHVWFTGGEPTMQSASLVNYLKEYADGTKIYHICTAGWIWNRELYERLDWITIDIKAPSSQTKSVLKVVDQIINEFETKVELKMVVSKSDEDREYAMMIANKYEFTELTLQPLYISEPELQKSILLTNEVDCSLTNWLLADFADWVTNTFKSKVFVRMGLQLHKHLYPERTRGI